MVVAPLGWFGRSESGHPADASPTLPPMTTGSRVTLSPPGRLIPTVLAWEKMRKRLRMCLWPEGLQNAKASTFTVVEDCDEKLEMPVLNPYR